MYNLMVVQAKARIKKWGNSLGIVIPKEAAEKNGLRVGEEVEIRLTKLSDITELRGKYPIGDLQAAKEEMRKGWRG
jgi:antitoxin component of MazEF toxin-antitoxin module